MSGDYYGWSKKEEFQNAFLYLGFSAVVSFLFYESFWVVLILLPGVVLFRRFRREEYQKKKKLELSSQFVTGIQLAGASLQAGYSIENAFRQALLEIQKMYEEDAVIVQEFKYIEAQLNINRNLEELLEELAKRSQIEDIQSFAEVFGSAKRTGGDLAGIIQNTVQCIARKAEAQREIQTSISAKKLEQKVMSMVPFGILVYVKMTSDGFLDNMYHNITGVFVMSICLIMWLLAFCWGRKIVEIEV